jgi:anti-sigma factor RsiW
MDCREVIEQFLMDYVSRALSPEQEAAFDLHLAQCPSCVNYLRSYQETVRLGGSLGAATPADEVPESLVQAVLAVTRQ